MKTEKRKCAAFCYAFTICSFFASVITYGQILNVTEIPSLGKKTHTLVNEKVNYVDINSSFDIKINKDTLKFNISDEVLKDKNETEALITQIKSLTDFSTRLLKESKSLDSKLSIYQKSKTTQNFDEVKQSLKTLAETELDFIKKFVDPNPWLYKKYDESFNYEMQMHEIFCMLIEEMQNYLNLKLDSILNQEGVYVQIAGWIITKSGQNSIHLVGLDEYPLGEYYEHPIVNLQLTSDQIDELQAMSNTLSENADSYQQIIKTISGEIAKNLETFLLPVQGSIKEIEESLKNIKQVINRQPESVKQNVNAINNTISGYKEYLEALIDSYKTENIVERDKFKLLMRFNKDQKEFIETSKKESEKLKKKVTTLFDEIATDATNLKDQVQKVKTQIESLASLVEKDLNDLKNGIETIIYGSKFNSDLLVFGDKVKKLSVDVVPSETYFSLKYTGKREPGDQVILKVGIGTSSMIQPTDVEVIYLNLLEAEPHINMAVAYDFAWPVSRLDEIPPNGPSYSILYKFRSRKPIYRNIFDLGLGLNFATFDFNKDDIPEIAAGICASFFRDYLEAGWGFNFNANTGYYFVGIRIPISINSVYFNNTEK